MNSKRLIIIILVIILLVAALLLIFGRTKGTFRKEWTDFATPDTSSVSMVFLADKQNRAVKLRREPNGQWILNDTFPANQQMVSQLLGTVQRLSVRYPVPKSGHNSVISRIAAIGVKVEMYQQKPWFQVFGMKLFTRERLVKTYYVGDNTQDNMGTYFLMEGADRPFVVYLPGFRGFISSRFTTRPEDWRDHRIFSSRLFDISSVMVEFPSEGKASYKVINNDDRIFTLETMPGSAPGFPVDTLKLLNFLASFDNIRFEAFVTGKEPHFIDSVRNSRPLHIITITDKQGRKTTATTYLRMLTEPDYDIYGNPVYFDRDRMYAFANEGKDFVLVQYFVFNRITRDLGWFALSAGKDGSVENSE